MASTQSMFEGSVRSSVDGIEIVNFKGGETVGHSLVLIEGYCSKEGSKSNSKSKNSNLYGDVSKKSETQRQELTTEIPSDASISLGQDHVLVENGKTCTSWPVVAGGFKALVSLSPGLNTVSIKASIRGEWKQSRLCLTYKSSTLPRFVRVVYIKCADSNGNFQAPPGCPNELDAARKKLAFNARLLQTFTAHNLHQHGLGHTTFRLQENSEGEPLVHVFTSTLATSEALQMTGGQLYDRFSQELTASSLYDPLCKLWAFMCCTQYDPPPPEEFQDRDIPKYVKGHTALGGGQLALFGTGGLHTWAGSIDELVACFSDTTMIDKQLLFDDSSKRGTYWANYATCLGASMHELGHCFDLAHTPKGIMGRGFDDMNCVFTLWKNPQCVRPAREKRETTLGEKELTKEYTRPESDGEKVCSPSEPVFDRDSKHVGAKSDSLTSEENVKRVKLDNAPVIVRASAAIEGLCRVAVQEEQIHDETRMSRQEDAVLAGPGDWSHGANWYRSSAVLLRYHKWLSSTDQSQDHTSNHPIVHWGRRVRGPVGNFGGHQQPNQTRFNDVNWLSTHGGTLGGFVIHADEYVNCIQTIGRTVSVQEDDEKSDEHLSKPQGTDGVGQRYVFTFTDPDEYLVGVDVRAGGWVDALRIHTTVKSSVWMGGTGGDLYEFRPPPGQRMAGLCGTAGKYVGSLGVLLDSASPDSPVTSHAADDDLIVDAPHGIRLIELHNKKHGEVYKHWEFLEDDPPRCFSLPRAEIMAEQASIEIEDDKGNICRTGQFYDYTDVLECCSTSDVEMKN